jgi:hypothetical protein
LPQPDRRCVEMVVTVAKPFGLFSQRGAEYEYAILLNGTSIIYRPGQHQAIGD